MIDDDWAASIVARHVGATKEADHLLSRSSSWKNLFNTETGFIEARNSDGSFAGEDVGWTEGDHWAYSLDVMASRISVDIARAEWAFSGAKLTGSMMSRA